MPKNSLMIAKEAADHVRNFMDQCFQLAGRNDHFAGLEDELLGCLTEEMPSYQQDFVVACLSYARRERDFQAGQEPEAISRANLKVAGEHVKRRQQTSKFEDIG